jgi:ribosome biogenesis GTPase A
MKSLRALRIASTLASKPPPFVYTNQNLLSHFFSAEPDQNESENDNSDSVFDSTHYTIDSSFNNNSNTTSATHKEPTWDERYRERVDKLVFKKETQKGKLQILEEQEEQVEEQRRRLLAKALLEAALERPDEEEGEEVREEDQKSLSVGIIGAPNAGKSALTNFMVWFRFFFFFFFFFFLCLFLWWFLIWFCVLDVSAVVLNIGGLLNFCYYIEMGGL